MLCFFQIETSRRRTNNMRRSEYHIRAIRSRTPTRGNAVVKEYGNSICSDGRVGVTELRRVFLIDTEAPAGASAPAGLTHGRLWAKTSRSASGFSTIFKHRIFFRKLKNRNIAGNNIANTRNAISRHFRGCWVVSTSVVGPPDRLSRW